MTLWPDGKKFAFTVFDDPDSQTESVSREVYSLLYDLGFATTKAVWPLAPRRAMNSPGETCEANPSYLAHCQELQARGFEIGFHNASPSDNLRQDTIDGFDLFKEFFGHDPISAANHYNHEALYWGPERLSGLRRSMYNMVTFHRKSGVHHGHVESDPSFWGDVCRDRVRYFRNFVYSDINTLKQCPLMPYYNPLQPYVRGWFASTEGANRHSFVDAIAESNQDRLEEEGGACIMYTHFAHSFCEHGKLNPRFVELMTRLAKKGGWFVPVAKLLGRLEAHNGGIYTLTNADRERLEWRWLAEKVFRGTS